MEMPPKYTIPIFKFVVQLPDNYHRKLKLWAKIKGTARATLAANIIQARIEANWETVSKEIDDMAKREGMSREEMESALLNGDDD